MVSLGKWLLSPISGIIAPSCYIFTQVIPHVFASSMAVVGLQCHVVVVKLS